MKLHVNLWSSVLRLNTEMDSGQTVCKNRALPHSLQKQDQETDRLSSAISPGSQPVISQTCRRSDNSSNNPGSQTTPKT